jgi:hypothetical protein
MTIYDPPTAEATKAVWQKYLNGLNPKEDQSEILRTKKFMEKRFAQGFDLSDLLKSD